MFKQNLLMMNFLGDDGFPAPNLKDVENMDGFSSAKRVVHYYCETIVGVKRLYICAQLIHGDLSEYNIMLVPSEQIRQQVSSVEDQDLDDPSKRLPVKTNRIVLIDFAQAVQVSLIPSKSTSLTRNPHAQSSCSIPMLITHAHNSCS